MLTISILAAAALMGACVYAYRARRRIRGLEEELANACTVAYDAMVKVRKLEDPANLNVFKDGRYYGTVSDLLTFYLERQTAMGSVDTQYGSN